MWKSGEGRGWKKSYKFNMGGAEAVLYDSSLPIGSQMIWRQTVGSSGYMQINVYESGYMDLVNRRMFHTKKKMPKLMKIK